jgi:hypothetical protein
MRAYMNGSSSPFDAALVEASLSARIYILNSLTRRP